MLFTFNVVRELSYFSPRASVKAISIAVTSVWHYTLISDFMFPFIYFAAFTCGFLVSSYSSQEDHLRHDRGNLYEQLPLYDCLHPSMSNCVLHFVIVLTFDVITVLIFSICIVFTWSTPSSHNYQCQTVYTLYCLLLYSFFVSFTFFHKWSITYSKQ